MSNLQDVKSTVPFTKVDNVRKPGQPKTDRSDETPVQKLKRIKQLQRTDWGGKPAAQVIYKKMLEYGIKCGPKSLEAIQKIAEDQVAGCRARTSPRVDDLIIEFGSTNEPDEVLA